jgi:hypothetical protein
MQGASNANDMARAPSVFRYLEVPLSMVDPAVARGDAPTALIIADATAEKPEFSHTATGRTGSTDPAEFALGCEHHGAEW